MPVVAFRAPARRRLHEDVAEQLRDAILDGRFAAGRKLPPERELAQEFGVNRTSVREALKVLEGLGLVTVRQGANPRRATPAVAHYESPAASLLAPVDAAAREHALRDPVAAAEPTGGAARRRGRLGDQTAEDSDPDQ